MPKIIPPFTASSDRGYKFLRVFDQYYASRGGRLVLWVEGGIAPYDWVVTGSDCTLDAAQTAVQYNFITIDDAATLDNTETITITDANNESVTIVVCTCNPINCEDAADYALAFGSTAPADLTMGCNSAQVFVIGGCPPYQWTVTGGEVELGIEWTNKPSNRFRCPEPDCSSGGCTFEITVVDGESNSVSGPCPTGTFAFDDASTADTIVAGATISIYVSGGLGPYAWSVVGTGYTLGSATTPLGTVVNTLISASGSCGVHYDPYATVTVTDGCGIPVEFSIRNTGGQWVQKESATASPRFIGDCGGGQSINCQEGGLSYNAYDGYRRWRFRDTAYFNADCTCDWTAREWSAGSDPPLCGSPYACWVIAYPYLSSPVDACCGLFKHTDVFRYYYYEWEC